MHPWIVFSSQYDINNLLAHSQEAIVEIRATESLMSKGKILDESGLESPLQGGVAWVQFLHDKAQHPASNYQYHVFKI